MTTRRNFLSTSAAASLIFPSGIFAAPLDNTAALSRIAFGSCAMQWKPQPIWSAIAARDPDLFLFLGDAIYGDFDGKDVFKASEESLLADWGKLASIPEFAAFREEVPIYATWDNHDYGKHDGGAEFELKDVSKKIFLDFFGEPENSERRKRPGIYDSFVVGPVGKRVQIILLDCRTFKSAYVPDPRSKEEKAALNIRGQYLPNADPQATLLGEDQWRWLAAQLSEPAELRLIASGTQIVADEKAMEEWGNFSNERRRLFDLIDETAAEGVVLLSGNVHFSEISQAEEGPYPLTDFTSSGMTHSTPAYAELRNSKRIAGPFVGFNFGEVLIDWNQTTVTLVCLDAIGQPQFEHPIKLSDLRKT